MSDTVEKKNISEQNLSTVHPSTSILSNSKCQIRALKARNSDIRQICREENIVDEMVLEHLLERLQISALEDRADGFKGWVVGDKHGKVGDVLKTRDVVANVAEIVGQIGCVHGGVEVEEVVAAGEELKGSAEAEDCVDLVDDDRVTNLDVLQEVSMSFISSKNGNLRLRSRRKEFLHQR